MQLRVVLIGAALLIAIFADLLALRIGHTENQGLVPTKRPPSWRWRNVRRRRRTDFAVFASREITVDHSDTHDGLPAVQN